MSRYVYSGIAITLLACVALSAHADEYVGGEFRVLDPVIAPSGYSTSSGFSLWGTMAQVAAGTSTSGSFEGRSGFEYFPFVTTPALSATPNSDTEIGLSWTAAQGFLGWNVGSYQYGRSTSSGGPYTYTGAGLSLVATASGLSADTTYYFVVTVADAFGRTIATSTQASATTLSADDGGGGGGSGGGGEGEVSITGLGAARGTVHILKDGVEMTTISVGSNGRFDIRLSDFSIGSYVMTFYVTDSAGTRSGLLSFPITITSENSLAQLNGIFLPPTIRFGENTSQQFVTVTGATVPDAKVGVVVVERGTETVMQITPADGDGVYGLVFPRAFLDNPQRVVKSFASVDGAQSAFGLAISLADASVSSVRGDFNEDGLINLVDFSILAYWHKRPNPPARLDLNGDGVVTLPDFSILTFYWTG